MVLDDSEYVVNGQSPQPVSDRPAVGRASLDKKPLVALDRRDSDTGPHERLPIGFDFTCDEAPLLAEVARRFAHDGNPVAGLTLGRRWRDSWKDLKTFALSRAKSDVPRIRASLARIESEYGDLFPASFPIADRMLTDLPRERQMQILVGTFESVERFVSSHKPAIFFSTGIAYLYNLVSYAVCRKRGVVHVALVPGRSSEPRFGYMLGIDGRLDAVVKRYAQLRAGGDVDPTHMARSSQADDRDQDTVPSYMKFKRQSLSLEPVFVSEFFRRLYRYYAAGWGLDREDYLTRNPFWYVRRDLAKLARARVLSWRRRGVFDTPTEGERYFMFPLHLQPEASTIIHARWYVDQIQTVRNVAQCLPADCLLYVKEHISAVGRNRLGFYRRLRQIPNVRLIGPWERTPQLLESALGVIVLTSTMGWEAIQMGKLTLVLGDVFYNDLSPDLKVAGWDDLRSKLRHVRNGRLATVPDSDIRAFQKAVHEGTYPGMFDVCKMDTAQYVLDKANVELIHRGLTRVIEAELPQCAAVNVHHG